MGFIDDELSKLTNSNSFLGQGINSQDFSQEGFILPTSPGGNGTQLPSSEVPSYRVATPKRASVTWFIPDFGTVKMYINPNSITYRYQKVINQERTKGGYALQYWGNQLPELTISGTTGSSGVEGINVLYEIYQAEQIAFDNIALTISANNAAQGAASQIIGAAGSAIGKAVSSSEVSGLVGSEIAQGIFGVDAVAQSLGPRNIPTLSSFAFGIEMFYLGWVHRGFFKSMDVTESADSLGLFNYNINFVVTERRGYRYNNLPWQKSAKDGQSGDHIPRSFSRIG